ncbi:T9SS type A sorting domain-containing protein [Kaistella daneshvariae]|nr:T9SS type A sorting domain-containing protein [Kaistella daneshvariae]
MKKFLYFVMFIGVLAVGTNTVFAQSADRSLATHQKNDEGVLVVYPNPARDFLMVKTNDTSVQIKTVTFYSILGMQVAEFQVNKNSEEIRLDRLRPGKYLMRYLLSDNTQKVVQIVKQ